MSVELYLIKCKNCKYWSSVGDGLGTCDSGKIVYNQYPSSTPKDSLGYWDMGSYSADHYVGEDFGCKYFKVTWGDEEEGVNI